jgi:hypothetical protein
LAIVATGYLAIVATGLLDDQCLRAGSVLEELAHTGQWGVQDQL